MKDYLKTRRERPYVAVEVPTDKDLVQYGVPGMKWGKRRSSAALAAAATSTAKPDGPESSSARYSRLASAAKAGKGNSMSDDDLKFFNARSDALAKVNKLNQTDPTWMSATTRKILQRATEQSLQDITSAVAKKYLTLPITDKINPDDALIRAAAKAKALADASKNSD